MFIRTSIVALILAVAAPVQASTHSGKHLLQRIESLEKRIGKLESARTFATFMPTFAERFQVMHRAGEAGDWAVAAHELLEMKRLADQASDIDQKRGEMLQKMLGPSLARIESTIEHENKGEFMQALKNTIKACNACHEAIGSDFVKVTLDPPDNLSMRHPHDLQPSEAPMDHEH